MLSRARFIQILIAMVLVLCTTALAQASEAKYVPWGFEEYEFFGLTKQQLTARFGSKVEFREDMKRVILSPQKKGGCTGYDGPTFELTFTGGKVSRVQRVFLGCKDIQYGPVLESKEAALKYSIAGLSQYTNATEKAKLQAARAELSALQKVQVR